MASWQLFRARRTPKKQHHDDRSYGLCNPFYPDSESELPCCPAVHPRSSPGGTTDGQEWDRQAELEKSSLDQCCLSGDLRSAEMQILIPTPHASGTLEAASPSPPGECECGHGSRQGSVIHLSPMKSQGSRTASPGSFQKLSRSWLHP